VQVIQAPKGGLIKAWVDGVQFEGTFSLYGTRSQRSVTRSQGSASLWSLCNDLS
jgi:hypothetical protein